MEQSNKCRAAEMSRGGRQVWRHARGAAVKARKCWSDRKWCHRQSQATAACDDMSASENAAVWLLWRARVHDGSEEAAARRVDG